MSILVVDDSEDARDVMAALLRSSGYDDVSTADCAAQAYGLLGLSPTGAETPAGASPERAPDVELVLMDMDMPSTDGLEACRCIRGNARLRDVPVIFVTGKTDDRSVRAAFAAGAADCIAKPVRRAHLLATIADVLAHRFAAR